MLINVQNHHKIIDIKTREAIGVSDQVNQSDDVLISKVITVEKGQGDTVFVDKPTERLCEAKERKKKTKRLLRFFSQSSHFDDETKYKLEKAHNAVNSCVNYYGPDRNGLPSTISRMCRKQYCPVCWEKYYSVRRAKQMKNCTREMIADAGGSLFGSYKGHTTSRGFLLTFTWEHIAGRDYKDETEFGNLVWRRFQTNKIFKEMFEGAVKVEEVTGKHKYINGKAYKVFNVHFHVFAYLKKRHTPTYVKNALEEVWKAKGGGHIDVKILRTKSDNSLAEEFTKYFAKEHNCEGILLAEIIAAQHGKRTISFMGMFRGSGQRALEKDCFDEMPKPFTEEPPPLRNPKTGKLVRFKKPCINIELNYKAAISGDYNAQWLIRFIHWKFKAEKYAPIGHFNWSSIIQRYNVFKLCGKDPESIEDRIEMSCYELTGTE